MSTSYSKEYNTDEKARKEPQKGEPALHCGRIVCILQLATKVCNYLVLFCGFGGKFYFMFRYSFSFYHLLYPLVRPALCNAHPSKGGGGGGGGLRAGDSTINFWGAGVTLWNGGE